MVRNQKATCKEHTAKELAKQAKNTLSPSVGEKVRGPSYHSPKEGDSAQYGSIEIGYQSRE